MADFFIEYFLPVVGIIILLGLCVIVVEGALLGATFLTNMWCG